MRKYIYNFIQVFTLLLSFTLIAQVKNSGTKISDKIAEAPTELKSNSILELESKQKGFLLPRMTTAERNQIDVNTQTNTDTGLAIFNTTNDCIEYYSAITKKWVSLCGTPPPALIDLANIDCDELEIFPANIILQAGVPIKQANAQITLPINIHEPGRYQIDVYSRRDGKSNGYYFSTTGTFMSEGTQEITIIGQGTPKHGYENTTMGDELVVNLNGKEVFSCKNKQYVKVADTDYEIIAKEYFVTGPIFLGVNAGTNNTVTIKVNVKSIGAYVIESINAINGISLFGEGKFTELGEQEVTLRATGIATERGTDPKGFNIPIKTNSGLPGAVPGGTKIYAKVEPTKLIPNCSDIRAVGEFVQGSDIKVNGNYLTIPVEVKSPGKASIELKSEIDGFVFKSEEIDFNFNASTNNIVEVILKPESKAIPFGKVSSSFKFTKTADLDLSNCTTDFMLNFEQPPVDYEIVDCKDIIPQKKNFPGRKDITDDKFDIKIKVQVKIAGPYSITATTINGPSFTGSGVFETSDQGKTVTISLKANGQFDVDPDKSTTFTYSIAAGVSTTRVCTFTLTAGLPDIHVLRITDYYGTAYGKDFANMFIDKNFGLDGRYTQVASIKFSNYVFDQNNVTQRNLPAVQKAEMVKKFIEDNEVNIVLIDMAASNVLSSDNNFKPFDTFYVPEADGSFPILKTLVQLAKERKIALAYFSNGGTKVTTDTPAASEGHNATVKVAMMQYITDIIYPELPQSQRPEAKYSGSQWSRVKGDYCVRDQILTIPASLRTRSHYLNPGFLDPATSKLTPTQMKTASYYDQVLGLYSAKTPLVFSSTTSSKYIPLTEKYLWWGPNKVEGVAYYTVEDYPIVIGNMANLENYYFTKTNEPQLRYDIEYTCDVSPGRKFQYYNGGFILSLINGLMEDVKNGL